MRRRPRRSCSSPALASCVAFYVGRYLVRHGLERDGLRVTAKFAMAADRPAQVLGLLEPLLAIHS